MSEQGHYLFGETWHQSSKTKRRATLYDTRMTRCRTNSSRLRGFTLLEMMLVIAIIGILASMSIPRYRESVRRAREAVFQENLYMLRATIERFTLDQKRPPTSLQELVTEGYLAQLPKDITGSPATWVAEYSDHNLDPEGRVGIRDVHSRS